MSTYATFDRDAYWRATVRRLLILLTVWLIAGPIMGIILVEWLNNFSIGGIPFGFWMAQQGAIFVFVSLIFINAYLADRQDRAFNVHETPETTTHVVADH